jgi:hypothetical protein
MKSISSGPVPQIPSCKIRGRLIPAYDFLPRLKKLCLSLGFNDPRMTKSGKLAAPGDGTSNFSNDSPPGPDGTITGPDAIVVLSTKVPYEQNWGGYSGLPEQYLREKNGIKAEETPAGFILPYLQQYQQVQTQIHLSIDNGGRALITLPELLVSNQGAEDRNLRIKIEEIAEPSQDGLYQPLQIAGSFLTFAVAPHFQQSLENDNFPWKTAGATPIGEYLFPELFEFFESSATIASQSSFSALLLPRMSWIVAHKTPHLAATLVHLQHNFAREREMFVATGTNDLRNLLCVAGLDIDMKGFRGRTESYFVPWQACWKRHGYCYGNIYPLLQDDLFVALMNYQDGSSPEILDQHF